MIYSISEDVPSSWDPIIEAFITMAEYDVEHHKGIPIDNLEFGMKRGLLTVTYTGGSKITDAFAMFAREMSGKFCTECGSLATRTAFETPKCDNCD